MSLASRLRRMTRREIAWRATQLARAQAGRVAVRLRRPRWDRANLGAVLSPALDDPLLRAHIARNDAAGVQRGLARLLRERPSRFILDPADAGALRGAILDRWPDAARDASARADRLLGGEYDLLGYRGLRVAETSDVDWHFDPVAKRRMPLRHWAEVPYLDPANGDHKVIWELNRHQHWFTLTRALWLTRDRRYAWAILRQLDSWLAANPPLMGANWASMLELGFRTIAWTWALHALLADTDAGASGPQAQPWLVDMLVGIDRQLTHVEQNLSYYFSPNTHLTGEALALYVVGLALPELARSARWVETGRQVLLQEIERQIGTDGGHAERSFHYHRYTLDFYLLALMMARRNDDAEAAAAFADAVRRTAEFARAVADDEGRLATVGDDDGGMLWPMCGSTPADVRDSLSLAAALLARPSLAPWGTPETSMWLGWASARGPLLAAKANGSRTAARARSRALLDTGYFVARDGTGSHLVFDVGVHGYLNGGHAHADALAVTLTLDGRPLLVDPGTSTYVMDARIRDRLRCSMSHNTLTLDGVSSAVPRGPFHWQSRADARLHGWRHNPTFDWAEGSHAGYSAGAHRRTVIRASDGTWLFVDDVLAEGRHQADLHWHFDSRWLAMCDMPNRLRLTHIEGHGACLVHDADLTCLMHGDEESGLGWHAPEYGTLIPTFTARATRRGAGPFSVVTWVGATGTDSVGPEIARLDTESDPGGRPVAVRITRGGASSTFVVRAGEPALRDTRSCRVDSYHTDARLLHVGRQRGELTALGCVDASHVLALHDGLLSIASDDVISDLHVAVTPHGLDLAASRPPSRLRLQGALAGGARLIRLNGRELPPSRLERGGTLIVHGIDWADPWEKRPECVELPVSSR